MKCREIMGEPLTWWVESRSEPGKEHKVDWLHSTPNCSCNDWSMKRREHTARTGTPYLCAHLRFCKDQCWERMCEDIRSQQLAQ